MTRCRLTAGNPSTIFSASSMPAGISIASYVSLLDPAAVHQAAGGADLAEYRRTLRHDLRTPINAIKGYGEMLREDAADGERGCVGRRSRQAAGRGNPAARPDRRAGDVFRERCPAIGWDGRGRHRDRRTGENGREPAQGGPPDRRRRKRTVRPYSPAGFWWWTTMRRTGTCCPVVCNARGIPCFRPRTALSRLRWSKRRRSISSCSI